MGFWLDDVVVIQITATYSCFTQFDKILKPKLLKSLSTRNLSQILGFVENIKIDRGTKFIFQMCCQRYLILMFV